ncbi:MAG: hypothetical protein JKY94_00265 [Rhodobacteraceae bacterium]|nr:hypothetical protein [Paracoccaceae bacterium]
MAFITQSETHNTGFGFDGIILAIKTGFANWLVALEQSRTATARREISIMYPHIKLDQNADLYTK